MVLWGLLTAKSAGDHSATLNAEPPWKARSVVLAGIATLAGIAGWIHRYGVTRPRSIRRELYCEFF